MRPRLIRLSVAAFLAAGFLSLSPRASAELLTLNFQGETTNPGNPSVSFTLNGTSYTNFATGPFYWSQNSVPPNSNFPPPIATFCIEINNNKPLPVIGTNTTFSVTNLSGAPTIGNNPTEIADITQLYGLYYQTAWANQSTFHGDVNSTAFQIALWKLIYDGGTNMNLATGNFQAANLGVYSTTAQSMLNSLNGNTSSFTTRFAGDELVALVTPAPGAKTQDEVQDQIILRPKTVPAPPAVMLAGIGVLALLGRARWTRRTPTAA
jgi:hypothetical protein